MIHQLLFGSVARPIIGLEMSPLDQKVMDFGSSSSQTITKTHKEQVFWILPSIESQVGKESVKTRYEFLEKKFKNKVSLLHGRMSKDEIEFTMRKFKERETMILVSTTVIEVGVNIPSASLMIIEEAEKFKNSTYPIEYLK